MGYLQVGPQYYPPRVNGAQVIMRGPHGHRFAADPVRTRSGERGSGFRWWYEQMLSAGDYKGSWQPQQQILGVMGLNGFGALGVMDDEKSRITRVVNEAVTVVDTAQTASPAIVSARVQLQSARDLLASNRWEDSSRGWIGPAYESWSDLFRKVQEAHVRLIAKSGQVREDGRPIISPEAADPRTGKVRRDPEGIVPQLVPAFVERANELGRGRLCSPEQLQVPFFGTAMCAGVDQPRLLFRWPLASMALALGGGLLLYGLAKGVGSGLASRRQNPRRNRRRRR